MFTKSNWFTAMATTLALISTASATLTDELRERKLPNCDSTLKLNDIQNKGDFWYYTGAQQYADDYINSNTDHTLWAQNLYRELLGREIHSDFDCTTTEASCVPDAKCEEWNAINKGGLYYLYVSLKNFHVYMKALKTETNNAFVLNSLSVSEIFQILNLPSGEQDETPNIFAIMSGAAGIGSGLATNPAAAGPLGALSGVFGMLGELVPKDEPVDTEEEAKVAIDRMIKENMKQSGEVINRIVAAVFGKFGQSQDAIPDAMLRGGEGVKNRAVSVFGWGDWVRDDGNTAAAQQLVGEMVAKADQALLWQMLRLYKRAYVVVRSDLSLEECTNPNNAWDAGKSRCLDLLTWDGSVEGTLGGANDLTDNMMWSRWNMDPFWTMRNAVDCWENNGGKLANAKPTQNWESSLPPACFFAMEVLKGSYSDIQKGTLWLDGDFAGQDGMDGKLWPKSKCDSALEVGAEECEFKWNGEE